MPRRTRVRAQRSASTGLWPCDYSSSLHSRSTLLRLAQFTVAAQPQAFGVVSIAAACIHVSPGDAAPCPPAPQDRAATREAVAGITQSAEAAVKAMERGAQLREAAKAEREEIKKATKGPLSFNQKVRTSAPPPLLRMLAAANPRRHVASPWPSKGHTAVEAPATHIRMGDCPTRRRSANATKAKRHVQRTMWRNPSGKHAPMASTAALTSRGTPLSCTVSTTRSTLRRI